MHNSKVKGRKETVLKRKFPCSLSLILKARRIEGKERLQKDCLLWITTSGSFHPKLGEREQRSEMGMWVAGWRQSILEWSQAKPEEKSRKSTIWPTVLSSFPSFPWNQSHRHSCPTQTILGIDKDRRKEKFRDRIKLTSMQEIPEMQAWSLGLEDSPHGNALQYSCLENPMDRGAWWAIVHAVSKGWTWLKRFNTHTQGKKKRKGKERTKPEGLKLSFNFSFHFLHFYLVPSMSIYHVSIWLVSMSAP